MSEFNEKTSSEVNIAEVDDTETVTEEANGNG